MTQLTGSLHLKPHQYAKHLDMAFHLQSLTEEDIRSFAAEARGATLTVEVIRCIDVVAPRKFATIRHAGELVERRGFVDEFPLDRLPLVPSFFSNDDGDDTQQVEK